MESGMDSETKLDAHVQKKLTKVEIWDRRLAKVWTVIQWTIIGPLAIAGLVVLWPAFIGLYLADKGDKVREKAPHVAWLFYFIGILTLPLTVSWVFAGIWLIQCLW